MFFIEGGGGVYISYCYIYIFDGDVKKLIFVIKVIFFYRFFL